MIYKVKQKKIVVFFLVLFFGGSAITKCSAIYCTKVRTIRYKIDSISVTNSSSCSVCNGSATVWVSGGFIPYTYLWTNNATSQTISGLCAGSYGIMVVDSNHDTITGICIIGPASPTAIDSTKSTCINTGSATVYAIGGTGQYTYSWSNGATTSGITGVTAGAYNVTVTDSNGCKCFDTAIVEAGLHFTLSGTNATCNADSNGSATVSNVTDGASPYTYSWSPISGSANTITGLLAGVYTITVNDTNGCFSIDSITITQPPPLITVYDTVADTGSCTGKAMLNITGGFAPYTFMWTPSVANSSHASGSDTAINLCYGTYFLCTTDSHGCSVCDSVYIRNAKKVAGIENVMPDNYDVSLFPNPANDKLNITLPNYNENAIVDIYDMMGKQVMEGRMNNRNERNISLNTSAFPSGVYMLRISHLNHYSTKSFIINH